jgi:hypothetical protein
MVMVKKTNNKCRWDAVKKEEHLHTADMNANQFSHYGNQCEISLKN